MNSKPRLSSENEPIAIIGIGCRFPGGANSTETFWQMLRDEVDAITEIPSDRFDVESLYDSRAQQPGKIITREGGFLENIDQFDAGFFGISPREANFIDPQQRLLLEVAWEALEDGGQVPGNMKNTQTGVFVGMWTNDYEDRMYQSIDDIDLYITTGGGRYSASGRLSFAFDFRGPSLTVDTACSSSLVSVHLACHSLWNGESTMALAGGVNLILEPQITIGYSRSRMLSPDARCKFGDVRANGYVRSEGVGLVVLKTLSQAQADGDPIYALIRGSAVNNDGRSSERFVAPGIDTQVAMLREAYRSAGVNPGDVTYVEAHGTGTGVGDPVEIQALGTALGENRPADRPCIIGSVKTNIGHTEAASGIAGLIKAALTLKHRAIPASLHFQQPNPNIPWNDLSIQIQTTWREWPEESGPALAGVNSFGVTGTNAHIVLQEAPGPIQIDELAVNQGDEAQLIPLSAHTPEALNELAQSYMTFISNTKNSFGLDAFGYATAVRRSHQNHRLTLVAQNQQELADHLQAFLDRENRPGMSVGQKTSGQQYKVVFVFSGQGSHWLGMGRELLTLEPVFRHALEQCEVALRPFTNWSLLEQLAAEPDSPAYRLNETNVMQPTLVAIEIALAALWSSYGIEPDAVIGHSLGEVAAAYVAGALSLEDAMQVICSRSQLMARTSGQGAMVVVELTEEKAQAALAGYEDRLTIAVINSPTSTVLSGDPAALDEVVNLLQAQDVLCRRVNVDIAFHSPQMDPLKDELFAMLSELTPKVATIPTYSTTLGKVMGERLHDAAYWVKNLRQPVRFSKMIQHLLTDGHNVFIEMSPHPILSPPIQQGFQFAGREGIVVHSLRRNQPEHVSLLESLGTLYTQGIAIDWNRIYPPRHHSLKLPSYPWQRERFWFDASERAKKPIYHTRPGQHPLLGQYLQSANGSHHWEVELSRERFPYLDDHRVGETAVLPAAVYLDMTITAAIEMWGEGAHVVEKASFKQMLTLPEEGVQVVQLIITPDLPGSAAFQFFSRPFESETEQTWTLHAAGTIRQAQEETDKPVKIDTFPDAARLRTMNAISGAEHYQMMTARGLQYGSGFQGVVQLWHQGNEAFAELKLPESIALDADVYQLHPTLLDACIQLLIAPQGIENNTANTDLYLPVSLDSLQVYGQLNPAGKLWGYIIDQSDDEMLKGDLFLLDEDKQLVTAVYGMQLQRIERSKQAAIDELLYEIKWRPQPALAKSSIKPDLPGTWMIFTDENGVAQKLAAQLERAGETCVMVSPGVSYQTLAPNRYQINPANPESFQQLLTDVLANAAPTLRGIVHLWSLTSAASENTTLASQTSAQEQGPIAVLHLIQALNAVELPSSPRLWLLTRGAKAVDAQETPVAVAQSPLWGLGEVIALEHPELRCTRIDLDPAIEAQENDMILAELWSDSFENQIALRKGSRYAARLIHYTTKSHDVEMDELPKIEAAPGQPYSVEVVSPGILDSLAFRATDHQVPGPGQIEIKIHAAGLNFIDVMKAMGIYPGLDPAAPIALGAECAGVVTAVNPNVTEFQVGDKVIAITPSFDNQSFFGAYATVPIELAVAKPAHITFEEAAAIPVTFLTAYYAMIYLGRLSKGERILIHSATGGVGLSAVQLAKMAGAEIFATAGSPEKRAFLRELGVQHVMDSRSLDFAEEVMSLTAGEGVDMVLNSLTGEALRQSFAILKPYGRFLEIGKQDIYQNNSLGLEPFKKNLSFFAIDLARITAERPLFIKTLFQDLIQHFENRTLQPLPVKSFPISQVSDAFRFMAQAKHIGKIALSMQEQQVMLTQSVNGAKLITADAAYLIAGGLGGLGLEVAHWLIEQGARHLVLVGRSAPSSTVQSVLDQIKADGITIKIAQADITIAESVTKLMQQIENELPPLRGVVHAAGVLDDGILLQQNQERFKKVMAPKLDGAWNLHLATQNRSLDFFIMFSSITSMLGSPGQGNYVAANAFLDALAHHRRAMGQPALSINWGPWAEVGMAAAQSNRGDRLAARGIGSMLPKQGIAALERIFSQDVTQVGITPFNLEQWAAYFPAGTPPFYNELEQSLDVDEPAMPQENSIRDALLAEEPGRRRQSLFETYLREQVAQVLRLAPSRVPLNQPLKTLGVDSLMTLELKNRLESGLGVTLSATFAFNYPTLSSQAPYLAEKMGISLKPSLPKADDPDLDNVVQADDEELLLTQQLEDISNDEVEQLLSEELGMIDDLLKGL